MSTRTRHLRPLLASSLLLLAPAAWAQPRQAPAPAVRSLTLPDTPAGHQLQAFLSTVDRGDAAALRRFATEHLAPGALGPRSLEDFVRLGLNLHRAAPRGLVVTDVAPRDGMVAVSVRGAAPAVEVGLTVAVAPERPDTITRLALRRAMPELPPEALGKLEGTREHERLQRIERLLASEAAKDRFSGVVLVARGDKPLLRRGYGWADRAAGVRNTPQTLFNLGSMNKMVTSVAVAQLVEQGKLSYDAPISTYLPDYPLQEVARKVTLHHLLTHTAGLGDFFGPAFEEKRLSLRAITDYVPLFAGQPLLFEPGQGWRYSNAGMLLAGLIVQRVSGQDYFDFVREHVYGPAGMERSDSYRLDAVVPNLAVGYTRMGGVDPLNPDEPRRSNVLLLPLQGSPAGGGYSSADELLRFSLALRRGALLRPESLERITTGKVDNVVIPHTREGYGFEDRKVNGVRVWGHGGMYAGTNTDFRVAPERDLTVVVLSNDDPMEATLLSALIVDALTRP